MIRSLVLLPFLALPLWAEEVPALYAVTGVAAGDVLNIRAEPDAGSAVIGSLAPDATGVEVVAIFGNWALVNSGEGSGYAPLPFLAREPGLAWNALQTPLTCLGTEPFWSLTFDPATDTVKLAAPDEPEGNSLPIKQSWPGTLWAPAAALALPQGTVVLYPAECSDGMSELSYGITVDLFLTQPERQRLSGCCSVAQP